MIVKNGEMANAPRSSLDRSSQSHEIASTMEIDSDNNATKVSIDNDQIALSLATKFLQQAANSGEDAQLERILQLMTAIIKNSINTD
jgi:hypothetical protein